MNSMRHLVLGAARSGKTRFALSTAKSLAHASECEVIYVATAEAHDAEMHERIERHRAERPATWRTLEAPRDLASALAAIDAMAPSDTHAASGARSASDARTSTRTSDSLASREPSAPRVSTSPVIIIDCLTLWLSNALLRDFTEDHPNSPLPTWTHEREAYLTWLTHTPHPVVLVSNEVGGGIVPTSALARRFQSEQGWLNQDIAQLCEHVTLVVAGLPMTLKAPANR